MSVSSVGIERITPFAEGEGTGVAAVKLSVGPMMMHAKLRKTEEGRLYLSMPARKNKEEKWFDHCYFTDRKLHKEVEDAVVAAYQQTRASDLSLN